MMFASSHVTSQIQHEQLRQSYAGTPLSMVVTLINACLLFYLLEPVTPKYHALVWLVIMALITLARLSLYITFRFKQPAIEQTRLWSILFTLGSFAAGSAWGAASIFLFPDDSIAHQVFIAFIIAGMTAAAVTTLSYIWRDALAFIVPALLLLIFRYLQLDTPISNAMGVMVTLYLIILLSSSKQFYQNNLQNIILRHETRQREQDLQQFKSTLDQTLDCVFMFTADTLHFFYLNQGAMDQVGYTHDELLQMHPYDIKPSHSEESFRQLLTSLLSGELASTTFETVHQHKDGHHIPVEIFLQYIHPQNEDARFVAIVRDITERKRLDKIKDEFVSTVSHELRTPLTSLRGSLGLIVGGAVGTVEKKQLTLLNIAQQNTERLLLLINDILDIDKIESGHIDFYFSDVDLVTLINKSIEENHGYAEKHHVNLHFTPPDFGCLVHVDPDRINQVMSNLLSNAAKFSPPGSNIEIHIETVDQYLRATVCDQGPGIPQDFEARVFDKFTQSDATDTRLHGGSGLGLAISKSIVEKHHGRIGFNTQPGEGTCFYFELPSCTEKPFHK